MEPKNLYSWNVNGLKAILRKNFNAFMKDEKPEVLCLQETKAQSAEVQKLLAMFEGYHVYSNEAEKKGYSGTAVMTQTEPLDVRYGIGHEEHDREGRVVTLEFSSYFLVNVYVPNSGNGLKRLDYRKVWDKAFNAFLQSLSATKPVIAAGDFNVAHQEIDIARPKANYNKSAGYTQAEIDGFTSILESGFTDIFRALHPGKVKYSYWSYRAQARERNVGWRIDYFLAGKSLEPSIKKACLLNEVQGSDHCPLFMQLKGSA